MKINKILFIGLALIIVGIAIGLLIPRLFSTSTKATTPDPAFLARHERIAAEIQQLEARQKDLLNEHQALALQAKMQSARLRHTSSSSEANAIFGTLDNVREASDRKLRSEEILSELAKNQERIKELSGLDPINRGSQ